MHQQNNVPYVQAAGYQAIELNYQGGDLAMLMLLPDERNGLPELEKCLSDPMLQPSSSRPNGLGGAPARCARPS